MTANSSRRDSSNFDPEALRAWYSDQRGTFSALADVVRATLESLLKNDKIDFLSVTARGKAVESFIEKIERKGYADPQRQITDLAGIRVITFIEADVPRVGNVIKSSFCVHHDKSLDKSEELGVDRFGYRSMHYICDLGPDRVKLPEFMLYKELVFEIQVRTVLQHAWAEIEHDRSYKFSGVLPAPHRRRLSLIAGMLEIADREFNDLAAELDAYSREVEEKTKRGDLDVELNTASVMQLINQKASSMPGVELRMGDLDSVIRELELFGIHDLAGLGVILSPDFLEKIAKWREAITGPGLLRSAMMYSDAERYFDQAWGKTWVKMLPATVQMLGDKYGAEKTRSLLDRYKITPKGIAFSDLITSGNKGSSAKPSKKG